MTHGEGPAQDAQAQVDRENSLRRANRRRLTIAASATLGAAFIAAGLLAGPAFLPGIRDQIRDRDLLPVQIVGGAGFQSGGAAFGTPSGGPGSSSGGSPSNGFAAEEVADIILPGGQSLREIVSGAPGAGGVVDGATGLVDNTVDGLTDVLQDPTKATKFVEDTVDGARKLVDDTISTLPLPKVTTPPISVPGVPVTVPSITVPPITIPQVTVPNVTVPGVTVPTVTVPGVTVPPITTSTPKVTLPVTLPGL